MMRRVVLTKGDSFANVQPARRRIGGIVGAAEHASVLERMHQVLGPHAQLIATGLTREPDLRPQITFDSDVCTLEGRSVNTVDEWRRALPLLSRVTGAFALAWSPEPGLLYLARDRVGHRTLYYASSGSAFVFASSIRALLATGLVARTLDERALLKFLTYAYVPGKRTLIEGVSELLPGEVLRAQGSNVAIVDSFAATSASASQEPSDELALTTDLTRALDTVVSAYASSPMPLSATLSGGIDSSLVVALAALRGSLHTHSITFGAPHKDELEWSGLVAAHCGTDHTIVEIPAQTILAHFDDTMAWLDKPNGDPLTVPNALLFREASKTGTHVLNGEGGDPCFGGPKNLPMLLASLYGEGDDDEPNALPRSYLRSHLKCFDDLGEMVDGDLAARARQKPLEDDILPWLADDSRDLVGQLMALNVRFKGGHHILPKVDALSLPFGVTPRSPLFSDTLVDLASKLAPEWKLRGSVEKYLLKRSVTHLLPDAIINRPKSGMMVPVEAWFQGPMLAFAKERVLDGLAPRGLFRREFLERLLLGRQLGLRPRRGVKLWLLVTLESHLRQLGL